MNVTLNIKLKLQIKFVIETNPQNLTLKPNFKINFEI